MLARADLADERGSPPIQDRGVPVDGPRPRASGWPRRGSPTQRGRNGIAYIGASTMSGIAGGVDFGAAAPEPGLKFRRPEFDRARERDHDMVTDKKVDFLIFP